MQWVNKIIYFLSITNKESTVVNKKKKSSINILKVLI